MRCLNRVIVSGCALEHILFSETSTGTPACGFLLASTTYRPGKRAATVRVKINVYGDGLVEVCRSRLVKGVYLVVEGELMNRGGQCGDLTEIRALQVIFPNDDTSEFPEGDSNG